MMTLTPTRQDGSLNYYRMVPGDDYFIPPIVSSYRSISQESIDRQAYMMPELFLHKWASKVNVSETLFFISRFGSDDSHAIDSGQDYMIHRISVVSEHAGDATENQAEFNRLAAEWKQETAHLSSPSMIAEHSAYQQIIGMGREIIPLILRDLKEAPAHWFWALRSIARESPVSFDDRGDIDAMRAAWLDWGERRRYI